MTEKPNEAEKPSAPEFEVRYSEKFKQGAKLEAKRSALAGGVIMLAAAIVLFIATVDAYRTHTSMGFSLGGSSNMSQLQGPPFIGALIGLLFLSLSLYFFWQYFFRRQ